MDYIITYVYRITIYSLVYVYNSQNYSYVIHKERLKKMNPSRFSISRFFLSKTRVCVSFIRILQRWHIKQLILSFLCVNITWKIVTYKIIFFYNTCHYCKSWLNCKNTCPPNAIIYIISSVVLRCFFNWTLEKQQQQHSNNTNTVQITSMVFHEILISHGSHDYYSPQLHTKSIKMELRRWLQSIKSTRLNCKCTLNTLIIWSVFILIILSLKTCLILFILLTITM